MTDIAWCRLDHNSLENVTCKVHTGAGCALLALCGLSNNVQCRWNLFIARITRLFSDDKVTKHLSLRLSELLQQ